MAVQFTKATRKQAKASILIEGLQGRGKSGLALSIARVLSDYNWDDVYAVDAENKSLSLFVDNPLQLDGQKVGPFNVLELSNETGYKPSLYAAARDLAIDNHGKVIINDSTTHMWQQKGGVLDMVNDLKKTVKDKYAVWGEPAVVAEKQCVVDLMRSPYIHVINTVRMKEKMIYNTDETGKTVLEKAGEQPIMMPDIAYEPDLVLTMVKAGNATDAPIAKVDKSRYSIFVPGETYVFTQKLIEQLRDYLNEGIDPEEIFEQQRKDYCAAITEILDSDPTLKKLWSAMKAKVGCKDKKLDDIPLEKLKTLLSMLSDE